MHPVQGCGRSGAHGPAGGDDGLGLGVRLPAGTRRAHRTLFPWEKLAHGQRECSVHGQNSQR